MSLMPCNMMELCSCTSSRDNEVGVASADNCTNAHGCAVSAGSAASDGAAPTKCRTAAGAVVAGTVCAADVSQTATSASALLFSTAASSASNMPRHSACSWPKQRSSWSNRRERRANRSLQRKVFGGQAIKQSHTQAFNLSFGTLLLEAVVPNVGIEHFSDLFKLLPNAGHAKHQTACAVVVIAL
eukprot:CAMPEP_0172674662 /NCGR_PEP_ID=MMETSP1074-20121228/12857_1 /TAXON_ID=2916 /ORGANISM="Ceratium fusus, Strain PA161109" /LENGTH=184 /DNA_ID=CAMNT_0013492085 /DNA_START=86 /DNA_END=639 /DNA_ORIENTATION=+